MANPQWDLLFHVPVDFSLNDPGLVRIRLSPARFASLILTPRVPSAGDRKRCCSWRGLSASGATGNGS